MSVLVKWPTSSLPDARLHNEDPAYIADLIEKTGLTHVKIAELLGVDARTVRRWPIRGAPYPVQYCLEQLAAAP